MISRSIFYITILIILALPSAYSATILPVLNLTQKAKTAKQEAKQEDGVIRVSTDLVLINATVTDRSGRYIANLQQKDFLLEDEGKKCEIGFFAAEEAPFAAVVLLDASGSMRTKLSRARVAASQFADNLREDDVTAVYGFNNKVEQLQDFSSSHDISPDVFEIEADGLTSLYDALYEGLTALSTRAEQRRAIILISDGGDSSSKHKEGEVLTQALKIGATVYTIDISGSEKPNDPSNIQGVGFLKGFAEKTGGQYIRTPGGKQLNEKLVEVSKELRAQYTIGFYPDQRDSKKSHKLTLKIPAHADIQIRARQSY